MENKENVSVNRSNHNCDISKIPNFVKIDWDEFDERLYRAQTLQCLSCRHCLPPLDRVNGVMCSLEYCNFEESKGKGCHDE